VQVKGLNETEGKLRLLEELKNDVNDIKRKLNDTRATCPTDKARDVRKYLNQVLKSCQGQSPDKQIEIILAGLKETEEKVNAFKKDFHCKQMETLSNEIREVRKKYKLIINPKKTKEEL
jgi:hypothetical protein